MTPDLKSIDLRILVPKDYQKQPIISRLISRYGLTVNIAAAVLTTPNRDRCWLDLQLQGSPQQLEAAIDYLRELRIEMMLEDFKCFSGSERQWQIPELVEADYPEENDQTIHTKLQVCLSPQSGHLPIIKELIFRYGLTVNISGTLLEGHVKNGHWFEIELWGTRQQILEAFHYLRKIALQIWL